VVPEFGLVQLREVIHPPVRIVYRLDAERVRVVRIWRSERPMTMP
jgi:plasmid stabilization system protein ParE